MRTDLKSLPTEFSPFALVVCAGFEERTPRAASLLEQSGARPEQVLLMKYESDANRTSYAKLSKTCRHLVERENNLREILAGDFDGLSRFVADSSRAGLRILCDITGLSRLRMFSTLSIIRKSGLPMWLLYTEAEEYYPKKSMLKSIRVDGGVEETFFRLSEYERKEIVYSPDCVVEDVPGFEGRHLPNYPLYLIAFLTFKRSRLSAILREYEASIRILIKGEPVRADLQWRADIMNVVNFDLIQENKSAVVTLETLNWQKTFDYLENSFKENNNNFRYNFLLAPLGSKMQTVGAWAFANRNPAVRVITSTPKTLFPDKYSAGYGQTFIIDDLGDL